MLKKFWNRHKDLRGFGILIGVVLSGISIWLFLKPNPIYIWFAGGALFSLSSAIILPSILFPFFWIWMKIGEVLNFLNTRLLLSIILFGMFTPVGLIRKLFGKDSLHRKLDFDAATYWQSHLDSEPKKSMKKQF